jgi:hypothetical protein
MFIAALFTIAKLCPDALVNGLRKSAIVIYIYEE